MTWVRVVWTRTDDRRAAEHLVRDAVSTSVERPAHPVTIGRLCPKCGSSRHGRPFVRGWAGGDPPAISVSRTSGITVVAVAPGGSVGVDVEDLVGFDDACLAEVLLHPDERASSPSELATTWVRKEAVLKAQGEGLALDPRTIRLSTPGDAPVLLEGPGSFWLSDVRLDPRLRAAVAGSGAEPDEITVREVAPEVPRGAATARTDHPAADPW